MNTNLEPEESRFFSSYFFRVAFLDYIALKANDFEGCFASWVSISIATICIKVIEVFTEIISRNRIITGPMSEGV